MDRSSVNIKTWQYKWFRYQHLYEDQSVLSQNSWGKQIKIIKNISVLRQNLNPQRGVPVKIHWTSKPESLAQRKSKDTVKSNQLKRITTQIPEYPYFWIKSKKK